MNNIIEDCMDRLRNKTKCWLIDNDSTFFQDNINPFGKNQVPIMCDFIDNDDLKSFEAYESGNRSIIYKYEGKWVKAKGIGIPSGLSKPIFDSGRIYTYKLDNDPGMCHRYILWGFMQKEENDCELYGAAKAKKINQRIELIGKSSFDDVIYTNLRDRTELFKKLSNMKRETLLDSFKKITSKTTAYSTYYFVPSDIRVKELFFTFMFPWITQLIEPSLIKEYVEWLGSSCGHLLRQFHDIGVLHGTWVDSQYLSVGLKDVHSNSYIGNYIVDEKGLTMCDFDLARPIENNEEIKIEKWALVHMANPLYYAGSYTPDDAIKQKIATKNSFREELAEHFERSVNLGYETQVINFENKLKNDILLQVVKAKELFWKLYGLPKELTGQIDYVDYKISTTKINKAEFRKAASTLDF